MPGQAIDWASRAVVKRGQKIVSSSAVGDWCKECKETALRAYPLSTPDDLVPLLTADSLFRMQFEKCHRVRLGQEAADYVPQTVEFVTTTGWRMEDVATVMTTKQFESTYRRHPDQVPNLQIETLVDNMGKEFKGVVLLDPTKPKQLITYTSHERVMRDKHMDPRSQCRQEQGAEVHQLLHDKMARQCNAKRLTFDELAALLKAADAADARVAPSALRAEPPGAAAAADGDLGRGEGAEEEEEEVVVTEELGGASVRDHVNADLLRRRAKRKHGARDNAGRKKKPATHSPYSSFAVHDTDSLARASSADASSTGGVGKVEGSAAEWMDKLDLQSLMNGEVQKAGYVLAQAKAKAERLESNGERGDAMALRQHVTLAAAAYELSRHAQMPFEEFSAAMEIITDEAIEVPPQISAGFIRALAKKASKDLQALPGTAMDFLELVWPMEEKGDFDFVSPRLAVVRLPEEEKGSVFKVSWTDYLISLLRLGQPGEATVLEAAKSFLRRWGDQCQGDSAMSPSLRDILSDTAPLARTHSSDLFPHGSNCVLPLPSLCTACALPALDLWSSCAPAVPHECTPFFFCSCTRSYFFCCSSWSYCFFRPGPP